MLGVRSPVRPSAVICAYREMVFAHAQQHSRAHTFGAFESRETRILEGGGMGGNGE